MTSVNLGSPDRLFRILFGLVLLGLYFFTPGSGPWHVLLLFGIVPLMTGLLGSCPLYTRLGITTLPPTRR